MARSLKTKKALRKRIKITGTGKIMKRPPGQNHFNAKDNGQVGRNKKGFVNTPAHVLHDVKALISKY